MEKTYWLRRWSDQATGWHQSVVEPALIHHFGSLQPTRVLAPLCGKSLDLAWLAQQGHEVVGVELSELACREFFKSQDLAFEVTPESSFQAFRSKGITLYQGDFFEMTSELLGQVGAVYDRAALIALPKELRARYAQHLQAIANPSDHLLVVIDRKTNEEDGPPFSVTPQEIESLFGERFRIVSQSEDPVLLGKGSDRPASECVYRLLPR